MKTKRKTKKHGTAKTRAKRRAYWKKRYYSHPGFRAKHIASCERAQNKAWAKRLVWRMMESAIASSRQKKVTVTAGYLESLWKAQRGRCYLTGVKMVPQTKSLFTVSVDRLDSTKDYTPGNVALCSKAANYAKSTHPIAEIKQWVKAVRNVS